jgi:hypothetical protein
MHRLAILLLIVSAAWAETVYVQPTRTVVVAGNTQQTHAYIYTDSSGNIVYVPARVIYTPPVTVSQPVVVQQTVVAPTVVHRPVQTVYVPPPRRYAPPVNNHYNTMYMHGGSHYRRPVTHRHVRHHHDNHARVSIRLPRLSLTIRK